MFALRTTKKKLRGLRRPPPHCTKSSLFFCRQKKVNRKSVWLLAVTGCAAMLQRPERSWFLDSWRWCPKKTCFPYLHTAYLEMKNHTPQGQRGRWDAFNGVFRFFALARTANATLFWGGKSGSANSRCGAILCSTCGICKFGEAVPLPSHAWFIPNNVICCARDGAGACAIRGADSDGDNFMFSNDPSLLKFLALTPEASAELRRAAEKVRAELLKAPAEPLPLIAAYRAYVLSVATLPVRGLGCAAAERAQHAVLKYVFQSSTGRVAAREHSPWWMRARSEHAPKLCDATGVDAPEEGGPETKFSEKFRQLVGAFEAQGCQERPYFGIFAG